MTTPPSTDPTGIKAAAIDFLEKILAGHISEAYARHASPTFRHHNPHFPGDAESLRNGMQQSESAHPNKRFEIQRALQDGDLVAIHSRLRLAAEARDIAVVHLFRFENGRIEEFWDVCQIAPETVANEHGLF